MRTEQASHLSSRLSDGIFAIKITIIIFSFFEFLNFQVFGLITVPFTFG